MQNLSPDRFQSETAFMHISGASNYTTYGSVIQELKYAQVEEGDTAGYMFGFNGQEMDDEVSGDGNSYTAEFWQFDSRLGRRFNPDIVCHSNFTTYGTLANNPILYIDKEGDDWFIYAKRFCGITYGYQIVWIPGNSVLFDPAKSYYAYLGPSLNFGHLYKYAYATNSNLGHALATASATAIVAPILAYHLALNSEIVKTLNKEGYSSFGGYIASTPNWFYDGGKKKKYDFATDMSQVFMANDKVNLNNFYTVIMYSFLTGKGPENFYFSTEHVVSKSLADSKLVKDALKMYKDTDNESDNAKNLRAGQWVYIDIGESDIFGILNRSKEDGTALNPEHLIGSALVKITLSEDGKNYVIQIWNSTSLGSGTLGLPKLSRPSTTSNNSTQPYTNVSQTYEIIIPIE